MTATSTTATAGSGGPAPAGIAADPMQRRTLVVLVVAQILGTIGLGVAPSIGILLAGEVTDSEAGPASPTLHPGAAVPGVLLPAARRGRRIALTTGWWTRPPRRARRAAQWQLVGPLFRPADDGAGPPPPPGPIHRDRPHDPGTRAFSLLVVWMGAIGTAAELACPVKRWYG